MVSRIEAIGVSGFSLDRNKLLEARDVDRRMVLNQIDNDADAPLFAAACRAGILVMLSESRNVISVSTVTRFFRRF